MTERISVLDGMTALQILAEAVGEYEAGLTKPMTKDCVIPLTKAEDEQLWSEKFARSQDALAKMAEEALDEYRQGKTRPLEELLTKKA